MIKIGSFFEEHIEKIILVIVGLVCVWLLITRVIFSPNEVSYNKEKFSPGTIDDHIYREAEILRQKLSQAPKDPDLYKSKVSEFLARFDSSISDIDTNLWLPRPYNITMAKAVGGGTYPLPRSIGQVEEVAVEHIRAVAYVPTEVVTAQNPYDKTGNEPNDIDLITVEGKYDISGLYDSFNEIFVEDVEPQLADPCLAKPIFAAVQLQRQELNTDGTWSDWLDVPRTKIDEHGKLFEIVEDIEDLPPGGLKVHMLHFDEKYVQIDLLQPQAYQIASANEEWFPPLLHRKFLDFQRKEALEERREAKETEREEREKELEEKRNRRSETRLGTTGRSTVGGYDSFGGMGGSISTRDSRTRRDRDRTGDRTGTGIYGEGDSTSRRRSRSRTTTATDQLINVYDGMIERPGEIRRDLMRPSINDVYDEYNNLLLTRMTDFAKIREPLVFWAHDDTVEPRKTYRYRIRLGVFNPLAGTDRISEQDKSLKNQVVLWSDFSDTTEAVEIPGRLYFFAKNIRDVDKTVTVQVSKLTLGHWYSHDFPVKHGEVIGNVIEPEPEKPERGINRIFTPAIRPEDKAQTPEKIDYSTGAVMVDAVAVNDWSGERALSTRHYYDMLYSYDGINIEHMPVRATYWSADLQSMFNQIGRLERQTQEPFKSFGDSGRRRGARGLEGEGMDYYYEDMMMLEEQTMDPIGRF